MIYLQRREMKKNFQQVLRGGGVPLIDILSNINEKPNLLTSCLQFFNILVLRINKHDDFYR